MRWAHRIVRLILPAPLRRIRIRPPAQPNTGRSYTLVRKRTTRYRMLAQEEEKAVGSAKPIVNDFTFQAATINGSGSQSSNLVLTRALFSMGIPVAPKNVFPSNIEGLPTWFNIRVSPQGYQCVNGEVNVLGALNPTTRQRDSHGVNSRAPASHGDSEPPLGNMKRDHGR